MGICSPRRCVLLADPNFIRNHKTISVSGGLRLQSHCCVFLHTGQIIRTLTNCGYVKLPKCLCKREQSAKLNNLLTVTFISFSGDMFRFQKPEQGYNLCFQKIIRVQLITFTSRNIDSVFSWFWRNKAPTISPDVNILQTCWNYIENHALCFKSKISVYEKFRTEYWLIILFIFIKLYQVAILPILGYGSMFSFLPVWSRKRANIFIASQSVWIVELVWIVMAYLVVGRRWYCWN